MKKKYLILLIITLILLSIYPCYKLITKSNLNEVKKEEKIEIDTWPDEPYGFEYLDEWQKELFYILRDELEVGETYYFEPKEANYINIIFKLFDNEPHNRCTKYGTPSYSGVYFQNDTNKIIAIKKINICSEEVEQAIEEKTNEIVKEINNYVERHNGTVIDKILLVTTYINKNVVYYAGDDYDEYNIFASIYGALIDGKANCAGQARSINYLLKKLGIYSITYYHKNAYTNGEPHLCTLVYIDGKYYIVDTTIAGGFLVKYDFIENYVEHIPPPITHNYDFNNLLTN